MSAFAVKGLSIKRGRQLLIDDLSFTIESPFFLALIGNNGSGKTSFLKAVLNQIPYKGEILNSSTKVGYIAQKHQLQFDIKVRDLVVMGAYSGKGVFDNYSKDDYQKVDLLLTKVGLSNKLDSTYFELSGGEQQLVWLAQQLMLEPQLLLLDEPTANLDVRNKIAFFKSIKKLVAEGTQVICVTHDLFFIKEMKGMLLNLSEYQPKLKELSNQVIADVYEQMSCF